MSEVKTRFAPSPTGFLHIGAIRTALFAWLVAKQNQGRFLLRIEDTDQAREVDGAVGHIKESLEWLNLQWDEKPIKQSDRLDLYRQSAQILIDKDLAYADPTTPEELNKLREQAKADSKPFHFREHRPKNPPQWDGSLPLRFKIDAQRSPDWHDEVRGDMEGVSENIDDFIIIKADGFPTYNFAHIVDDQDTGITHVIRGDEFISSMPKFLLLYQALGFETPKFAHLPPILAPTGNKKLSKRDGAGDLLEYRDKGYLPAGMINFLATLGWNDGTEQEIFTVRELISKFSLDRVHKAGARYDEERLKWINGNHIRQLSLDELYERSKYYWPNSAENTDEKHKKNILLLVHERLKFLSELPELTKFFFELPKIGLDEVLRADKQLRNQLDRQTSIDFLSQVIDELSDSNFKEDDLENRLRKLVEKLDTKVGLLFKLIRISVTGTPIAPGLFETLAVLGKKESLERLKRVASS